MTNSMNLLCFVALFIMNRKRSLTQVEIVGET